MSFSVEFRNLDEAVRDLKALRKKAVPFAVKDGLNDAAFQARRIWSGNIKEKFTTRNQFTARTALRVDKARGRALDRMSSTVGSIADFMGEQEFGGTVSGPVPGPAAARQRPGGARTRPVRIPVTSIAASRGRGRTRKQRNAIAIAIAKRRGKRHALLDRPVGGKGLFWVGGGKRKVTTKLLWSVDRGSSRLKPHPTLGPTMRTMRPRVPRILLKAVQRQMRKQHLFRF